MTAETLNLPNANSAIKARGEKEQNVWSALDTLYFDDKLPLRSLTIQRIQSKRAQLEDGVEGRAKGDARGLTEMKLRWLKSRGIDELQDANAPASTTIVNSSDPLFRVTQMVRAQLQEELEEKYQALLDEAAAKAFQFEQELDESKQRSAALQAKFNQASNRVVELEPLYDQAIAQLVEKEGRLKTKAEDYERQVAANQSMYAELQTEFTNQYQAALTAKDAVTKKLELELSAQKEAASSLQDQLVAINEAQRTDYMQAKIDLENRILLLEDKLKKLAAVESAHSALHAENKKLQAELHAKENYLSNNIVKLTDELNTQKNHISELHHAMAKLIQDKLAPFSSVADELVIIKQTMTTLLAQAKPASSNTEDAIIEIMPT